MVKQIIAPYGESIENRPPVQSLDEIITEREAKKEARDERRALRKLSEEEQRLALKKAAADERKAKHTAWEQLIAKADR